MRLIHINIIIILILISPKYGPNGKNIGQQHMLLPRGPLALLILLGQLMPQPLGLVQNRPFGLGKIQRLRKAIQNRIIFYRVLGELQKDEFFLAGVAGDFGDLAEQLGEGLTFGLLHELLLGED
jgi:hypothetical protein